MPIPRIVMNRHKGTSPAGGDPLFLSVTAQTHMSSTIVARYSEKKHETFVMNGACEQ